MRSFVFVLWFFVVFSCKAQQQIYPLNTDYLTVPNSSYLKDMNNELNQFVGTYKVDFQNFKYEIYISKEIQKNITILDKNFYQDILIIKFITKNSNGIILKDNLNLVDSSGKNVIQSVEVRDNNRAILYYSGTNCRIGWGIIELTKLNSTQLSWEYRPNSTVINSDTCPPGTDKKVYLPVTKDLIFTKQ